jgi:hypothetical protein
MPQDKAERSIAASAVLREIDSPLHFQDCHELQGGKGIFYPFLEGRVARESDISHSVLSDLAEFIATLHSVDTDTIPQEHKSALSTSVWPVRLDQVIKNSSKISGALNDDISRDIDGIKRVFAAHKLEKPILIHGDLGFENNILINDFGELSGIIDLEMFSTADSPLYEFCAFRIADFTRFFSFIELLNKAYRSRGLQTKEFHLSQNDILTAIKVHHYVDVLSAITKREIGRVRKIKKTLDKIRSLEKDIKLL